MTLMRRAPGQRRGSVVIMPSTSVQISMRSALRPAPKIAAEKSEPPRPIVVVMPARFGADESAHHCNFPGVDQRLDLLPQALVGFFELRDSARVGAVGQQTLTRIHVHPGNPRPAKAAATILLESTSPNEAT